MAPKERFTEIMRDLDGEHARVMEDFISRKNLPILEDQGVVKRTFRYAYLLVHILKEARIMFPLRFEGVACDCKNRAASTLDGIAIRTLIRAPSSWEISIESTDIDAAEGTKYCLYP